MPEKLLRIGIIGGSGLGQLLEELTAKGRVRQEWPETPFGKPSAPLMVVSWEDRPEMEVVLLLRHGQGHVYPPSMVPYRANVFALKMLGVTHVIASGAVGSLREEIRPGDLVIADQVIDKTYRRAGTFYDGAAVHVEFSQPFCPVMRQWLLEAALRRQGAGAGVQVHDRGTYVCMEGPAFSTVAESHMHRAWGGDMIGMTCMPEAKLAREAEMAYGLIALPTDYDCWRPHSSGVMQHELLSEIIGNLNKATQAGMQLIRSALQNAQVLTQKKSPAHEALAQAIWSDKKKISPVEVERLKPLWGHRWG